MRGEFALLLFCATLASGFQAAEPATPNLGEVTGSVVEVQSGSPVKKALVILRRGQEPGLGTITDEKGAFQFRAEPGSYTVTAERDGYVGEPGVAKLVTVKQEATESNVSLRLVRTGAISGHVLDEDGEPLAGVSVRLFEARNKRNPAAPNFYASTNDRGEYRIFKVAPGKYRLAASYTPKHQLTEVKIQAAGGASGSTGAYATTYYPATLDQKQAVAVDVTSGSDLAGYDLQLQPQHAVRIRGKITGPAGAIVMVTLQPLDPQSGNPMGSTLVRDLKGEFELSAVLPGSYMLHATAGFDERRLSARRAIDVGDTDLEGIDLALAAPQRIAGRVIVPSGEKIPAGLVVLLAARERFNTQAGGLSQVGPDGAISLGEVQPGDYDVVVGNTLASDDLYVSAIRLGDEDALSHGVHIGDGTPGALEVVLKGNGGTLQCLVTAKGQPLPDTLVRLLPDRPRRDQLALNSECNTDASGRCTVSGIAPGEYHAFAFAKNTAPDFRDPDALKDIEKLGTPVKVPEGAHLSLDLELIPDTD